jgi:hypothetical protein
MWLTRADSALAKLDLPSSVYYIDNSSSNSSGMVAAHMQ